MKRFVKPATLVCAAALLAACGDEAPDAAVNGAAPAGGEADGPQRAALQQRIGTLEAQLGLVEDSAAIKRLQYTYGYYLAEAMWSELNDLFAEDAALEIGLDGVYNTPESRLEYLMALGAGQEGLHEGELNEHFQVMPVIHVAPDGQTAEGRLRGIVMSGQLGESANWAEGPYLNTYVKQDGVWKFASVHWYDSVYVPYETGWLETPDPTGGHFITTLTPDAPTTVQYETWPGVHLPPFHFRNEAGVTSAAVTGFAPAPQAQAVLGAEAEPIEALAERVAVLSQETTLAEARATTENLQRIFGYYIDENMWSDAAALFTADATLEWGGSGVYRGPDNIRAYLEATGGPEGPQEGVLNDHMIIMPVVDVAPDGLSARGRFQGWNQLARHGEWARWGTGIYDTYFVNEGGVWKIAAMTYYATMETPYEDGWGVTALPLNEPLDDPAPEAPQTTDYQPLPGVFVAPFHYNNPVTQPLDDSEAIRAAAEPLIGTDPDALTAQLDSLDRRIGALTDMEELENLNGIYGYYLAHNQWDSLAGIFTDDGIIEIAMRGQYVGRDSVRRNLDLYGEQGGEQQGLLHNHMQFQPVITLAADGQTAKIRSRALSIMGLFGQYAQWMGGVYENDFTKVDGRWMIQRDQVFNTYFAPYAVGWQEGDRRSPPGVTDSNPPDLPPSLPFEMYPSPFVAPYHYPNPVTGAPYVAPSAG